jgi:RHS repeat-associated protein
VLGSARAVTRQVNGQWQVVARHDFMPFGEEVAPPTPPQDKRLFTGKERDNETGLDYFGARHNRPEVGRFTSVDPLTELQIALFEPQRWNRYVYVGNRPLRLVDPDGRGWASALFKVGKAVIKGGSIATEFYGIVDDGRTVIGEDSSLGERAWAVASLASEVMSPVSVKDAKGILSFAIRHSDAIEPAIEFTGRKSIRRGLEELSGGAVAGAHAHHMLPVEFGLEFSKRWGANVNDPKYGAWWNAQDHLRNHKRYTGVSEERMLTRRL